MRESVLENHLSRQIYLNLHFHSVFSKSYDLVHGDSHQKEEAIPGSVTSVATCPSEVKKILVKLNPNKAAGVDSIPARLLKCVANELANPVSWLFNLSFTRAIVPQLWKQANISPIYKDGDTGSVANYRGISLLSVVGRCQERILHTAIYDQVSQYLHDSHHGVLRGRSTVSQLVLVHDDWAKVLDNQGQVDVVFLDFSKAFDFS